LPLALPRFAKAACNEIENTDILWRNTKMKKVISFEIQTDKPERAAEF
jgi:hypothetical protein